MTVIDEFSLQSKHETAGQPGYSSQIMPFCQQQSQITASKHSYEALIATGNARKNSELQYEFAGQADHP